MQVEQLFAEASLHFEQEDYQRGLAVVDQCLALQPRSSSLFANRAVFHSQMGSPQDAVSDLERAITLNHLNYVAYFNLSSLQFNLGDHPQAFNNLCCSLSCLYLIRARKAKREIDVQRSIKYAQNNLEAHVLKALMYLEDGKQRLALNEIEWAEDIQPRNPLPHTLKQIIQKQTDNTSTLNDALQLHPQTQGEYRLQSTYVPAGDLVQEHRAKVTEFNEIYDELINNEFGAITHKVQRIKGDDMTRFEQSYAKPSEIYSIRPKNNNILGGLRDSRDKSALAPQQPPAAQIKQQKILEPEEPPAKPQVSIEQSPVQSPVKTLDEDNLLDTPYKEEEADKTKEEPQAKPQQESIQQQQLRLKLKESINQPKQDKKKQYPGTDRVIEQDKNSKRSKSLGKNTPRSSSRTSQSEAVALYPTRGTRRKIQFTIIGAQLKTVKDVKDVYVTGNYHSRKGQVIKTPNKKLEGNIARWYYSAAPTNLAQQPQTITLNLFNKRYFGNSDLQIGSGEIEVTNSGEIRCPVYFKAKVTGFVELRIDLI